MKGNMPKKTDRRKAWKGASGSVNATAETWKLAKLTFGWKSIGNFRVRDQPAVPLTDLDAQDGELKITVANNGDVQSQLERLFKRLTVSGTSIKIGLTLGALEIQFDRGAIRIWITCNDDLIGTDEVPLVLSPVAPVTKKGQEVVLKSF